MKKACLLLLVFLVLGVGRTMAGTCPPTPPTSRGNGMVAGISVAGGKQYYFTDALLAGFDCFEQLSAWFPSYIHSTNSINPAHEVVDMAYAAQATATFFNVTAPASGKGAVPSYEAHARGSLQGC